ncbi:hypothetical protein BYT27DRAFT_6502055 [Phlegmacium glaucopus]|nr:hypothetical protein BYT27DRAFT_6502055 [Phlegmacium glaucopus]
MQITNTYRFKSSPLFVVGFLRLFFEIIFITVLVLVQVINVSGSNTSHIYPFNLVFHAFNDRRTPTHQTYRQPRVLGNVREICYTTWNTNGRLTTQCAKVGLGINQEIHLTPCTTCSQ